MTRPPSAGPHDRYRPIPTPGPLGCNDRGDPYWRRWDHSPGPLGHNDHSAPLIAKMRLLAGLADHDPAATINRVIDQINQTPGAATAAARLRLCVETTKRDRGFDPAQDAKAQLIEAYFNARLLACEGRLNRADQAWATLPPTGSRRRVGEAGAGSGLYHSSAPSDDKPPRAAARPSHRRIGYAPLDDRLGGEFDPTRHWAEKGAADGLRDRGAPNQRLQPYS